MKKAISLFLVAVAVMLLPASVIAQAATVGQMQSKVISVAEAEVGYKGTCSYSKYGEWYGYQGGWCTTFVLWCFNKAGESLGVTMYGKIVPNGGNCNSMISWFKNKDRYHTRSSGYTPKVGDLVFFDWSGNGSSQHVGIVSGVSGSTVYTIEGNCSAEVKERKYTTTGSKPYNNVSAIMGYGNPNYSSVASGSSTTKRQTTTKKPTTTKRPTTTKKHTTTKRYTAEPTTANPITTTTTTTTQAETTTEATTDQETDKNSPRDMKLYAPTYNLEIGDSVKLDYQLKPKTAKAVVGYFCDEENIIEISSGGEITAIGEGVATVVVCANDEIYRQVDFTVTTETVSVTRHTGDDYFEAPIEPEQEITQSKKTIDQRLLELGVNSEKIKSHKDNYKYPLAIISGTVVISALVVLIRKAIIRKKKDK